MKNPNTLNGTFELHYIGFSEGSFETGSAEFFLGDEDYAVVENSAGALDTLVNKIFGLLNDATDRYFSGEEEDMSESEYDEMVNDISKDLNQFKPAISKIVHSVSSVPGQFIYSKDLWSELTIMFVPDSVY